MRILMLSYYYPPDLSAGSFRAKSISEAIAVKFGPNDKLDIITTIPNRYATYNQKAPDIEQHDSITIRRIYVPMHKSRMLDQSIAFLKYAGGVWKNAHNQQYDLVLATSSRLATAFLAALVAKRIGTSLYLDIRDIFTDTLKDVLSGKILILFLPLFRIIERYTIRSARCINLVSEGFGNHFKNLSPSTHFSFFPNGIDEEFLEHDFNKTKSGQKQVILYAGNIGEGQGLHRIIPGVAARLQEDHEFLVIGDGGMRRKLEIQLNKKNIKNVQVIDPVDRKCLLEYYKNSDYLFLHLNDYPAFEKVLPSKIFEFAATGKPIIAGVSGYAKYFIEKNIDNAVVFNPCDVNGMINAILNHQKKLTNRKNFINQYNRKTIIKKMQEEIIQCAYGKIE